MRRLTQRFLPLRQAARLHAEESINAKAAAAAEGKSREAAAARKTADEAAAKAAKALTAASAARALAEAARAQARPSPKPFASRSVRRTLNATGQSRVTPSLR